MSSASFHEYELKYALAASQERSLAAVLASRCRPDPEYPANRVVSLYFDTPDLRCLDEKRNGDRYKTKVRVRWYEDGEDTSMAWIEMKRRSGTARKKVRIPTNQRGSASLLSALQPDRVLLENGQICPRPLQPVAIVSYRRVRYVEPFSGARVCIDSHIEVRNVRPGQSGEPIHLAGAGSVVEVKGRHASLPPALASMFPSGLRRSSFSKYGLAGDVVAG